MKKCLSALLCTALSFGAMTTGVFAQADINLSENQRKMETGVREKELITTFIDDASYTNEVDMFRINYLGSWVHGDGHQDMFFEGTESYADGQGSLTMKFIGTKVRLYGTTGPKHGVYDIEIDGQSAGSADANSSGRVNKVKLFESQTLPNAEHTIKVSLSSASIGLGQSIQFDGMEVDHEPIEPDHITISRSHFSLLPGKSEKLIAQTGPWYAKKTDIVWSSSDPDVASVDSEGNVTAAENIEEISTAQIIASFKDNPAVQTSITVTVKPAGMFEDSDFMRAYTGNEQELDLSENAQSLFDNAKEHSEITKTLWLGDEASAKIIVASGVSNLTNVEITAEEFRTEDGVRLDPASIELGWLEEVKANIGRANSSAPIKDFPEKIVPMEKTSLDREMVKFGWITFKTSLNTLPGTYSGTVRIRASERNTPVDIPVTLEVLNLEQPAVESTELQIWQHPFAAANYELGLGKNVSYGGVCREYDEDFYFSDEHLKMMEPSVQAYLETGGHDVVANIVEEAWNHQSFYGDPSMVKWTKKADGTWSFNYDWYDTWINFMIDQGVIDPANGIGQIKCFSLVPWNNQIAWYDEASQSMKKQSFTPGNDDWKEYWTAFLTDFMAHSKEKGWLDITYISMDERGIDQLRPAVELVKSLKDEDGKTFKIASATNLGPAASNPDIMDQIEDISLAQGSTGNRILMKELCAHRRELGLKTTIYNCTGHYPSNFMHTDPAGNNWVVWHSMYMEADGYMRWAWDNFVYDMHGDVSYRWWEPGDGWFIYPSERGDDDYSIYSTPRFEMLKDGMRDVAKAKMLLADETLDAYLKDDLLAVIEKFSHPARGTDYGSAAPASEADRKALLALLDQTQNILDELARNAEKPSDKAELLKAIALGIELQSSDLYGRVSKELQSALDTAIEQAQMIRDDNNATAEQISNAAKAIRAAITAIKAHDFNYTILETVIDAIPENLDAYQEINKEALLAALARGKAVLNGAQSEKEIHDAAIEINANWLKMRLIPDETLIENMN